MTERYCPLCADKWAGAYNLDGACTTCGSRTHVRPATSALKVARMPGHGLPDPRPATPGAAALDIRIREAVTLWPGDEQLVGTGYAYEPPPGYALFLLPRSGLGSNHGIVLGNLVGLIDPDYRGELMAKLWYRRTEGKAVTLQAGERVAQLCCVPVLRLDNISYVDVTMLSTTERGDGGFGSTGRT